MNEAMAHITDGCLSLIGFLAPFWFGALGAMQIAMPLAAGLFLVELIRPGRKLDWKTVCVNLIYAPVFLTLSSAAAHPLVLYVNPLLPSPVVAHFTVNPNSLGWWLLLVVYLVTFDFCFYWFHRAQHGIPLLWRYHMLHHSDVNVSCFTSTRHHWFEDLTRYFFIAIPMTMIFGTTDKWPFWFVAAIGMSGLVIHWNMPWRLSWMHRWVVTPWYHRLHHSVAPEHFDKNFAVMFPIWDKLFQTQHLPASGQIPITGLVDLKTPNRFGLFLPWPL